MNVSAFHFLKWKVLEYLKLYFSIAQLRCIIEYYETLLKDVQLTGSEDGLGKWISQKCCVIYNLRWGKKNLYSEYPVIGVDERCLISPHATSINNAEFLSKYLSDMKK